MVPTEMATQTLLLTFACMIDRLPIPASKPAGRGRPKTYSDRLFLKAKDCRYPTRRTFERRLAKLPGTLFDQIGCLGRYLIDVVNP